MPRGQLAAGNPAFRRTEADRESRHSPRAAPTIISGQLDALALTPFSRTRGWGEAG